MAEWNPKKVTIRLWVFDGVKSYSNDFDEEHEDEAVETFEVAIRNHIGLVGNETAPEVETAVTTWKYIDKDIESGEVLFEATLSKF